VARILLVCLDPALLSTRDMVVRSAGYDTVLAVDLAEALTTAKERYPALVVIGHTFSVAEQDEFAWNLHRTHPEVCVLLLRDKYVDPIRLLAECEDAARCGPGIAAIREMRD
jgi:DNA-binding response OmpR family regulator